MNVARPIIAIPRYHCAPRVILRCTSGEEDSRGGTTSPETILFLICITLQMSHEFGYSATECNTLHGTYSVSITHTEAEVMQSSLLHTLITAASLHPLQCIQCNWLLSTPRFPLTS